MLLEERVDQHLFVGETPIAGADADAGVVRDVVQGDGQAALGERRPRRVGLFRAAVCQLALVLGLVVLPLRLSHQAVLAERPFLESGDPHRLSGTVGTGVGAGECPLKLDRLALEDDVVHEHLEVWKRRDETVDHIRDRRLRAAVDRDAAGWGVERRDLSRVVGSPGLRISLRELPHSSIVAHQEPLGRSHGFWQSYDDVELCVSGFQQSL